MGTRLPVTPFRVPEPSRSAMVAEFGEETIAACEAEETRWHDRLLNGDPDAPEPVGILRASSPLAGLT